MSDFTRFDATLMTQYSIAASDTLGRDHWMVTRAFRYYIGGKDSNRWVDIPLGYLTDGASVPQMFWNIIPPWGRYGQAAVVHDYLCEYLEIIEDGQPKTITRKDCDDVLEECMTVLGVPDKQVRVIHGAVALFRITLGNKKPTWNWQKRGLEDALKRRLETDGTVQR